MGWGWGWQRLLLGAVEREVEGQLSQVLSKGQEGFIGVSLPFFFFFFPLKPYQLPAPLCTCEATSSILHHSLGGDQDPRLDLPGSQHPSSFATWPRAQGSESSPWGTPFCHKGVHSSEHHSPHHPPGFISPFLGAQPLGRRARLWRGGVQLYEWDPPLRKGARARFARLRKGARTCVSSLRAATGSCGSPGDGSGSVLLRSDGEKRDTSSMCAKSKS